MIKKIQNYFLFLVASLLIFISVQSVAAGNSQLHINRLLQLDEAPDGVVFELLTWTDNTWSWASPMIKHFRTQLTKKYPDVDIVIVSHGIEQFELLKDNQYEQIEAISELKSMVANGISLHVCGAFSEMNNVPDDAYIDITDVAASGPAQIANYMQLGYKHVLLEQP